MEGIMLKRLLFIGLLTAAAIGIIWTLGFAYGLLAIASAILIFFVLRVRKGREETRARQAEFEASHRHQMKVRELDASVLRHIEQQGGTVDSRRREFFISLPQSTAKQEHADRYLYTLPDGTVLVYWKRTDKRDVRLVFDAA